MSEIEVRKFKDVDLQGGTVLAALPSVGLVSTIAATYMISALRMDQVMALDSDEFPPLSMVYAHKPKFPVRVYAIPKVAAFISEVPLPAKTHRAIARLLINWSKEQGAKRIVCLEGLPLSQERTEAEIDVWAVGSNDAANATIEKATLQYLETGIVSGVAGVLLNEGRWANYEVIALLGEARPYLPDAHAAAKLVWAADKILEGVEVDLAPLLEEAKELETHLQALKQQAKPVTPEAPDYLYR
ncbi:MAG TPA: PAC2 family protein [Thermoplasmata archaeon]|nr:PAC2 family protein [Thermoplasmata archaeon]